MGITHRSAAKDLGAGLYAHLNSTAFAYASRVFRSYVPQGTTCPYVVVQAVTENDGWACFGAPAKDCTFQVRVVSQSRGEAEAAEIVSATVGRVMTGWDGDTGGRMTVANHTVGLLAYEGSDPYDELDDAGVQTFHRVGRFRIHLCQST